MRQIIITKNFKETQKVGFQLVNDLKTGGVIALYGDLGSGKTTFTQGLAAGLGVKQKIISPTFIIVRRYELRSKKQELRIRNFYHIDLYRIENEIDIQGLGLEEIINSPSNIVAIEWPEKIEKILPKTRTDLYFEYLEENERKIEISK